MPIRYEQRAFYPINWKELALEIKEACGYVCQQCGRQCRRPGEKFDTHRRTLTLAHYDHVYDAPVVFVAVLCTGCHLRHDSMAHARARARRRILRQHQAGQRQFALTWRLL